MTVSSFSGSPSRRTVISVLIDQDVWPLPSFVLAKARYFKPSPTVQSGNGAGREKLAVARVGANTSSTSLPCLLRVRVPPPVRASTSATVRVPVALTAQLYALDAVSWTAPLVGAAV